MGYVYVLSNESMPGIFKIGMTERSPEERVLEANISDTFRPPTPYIIEIQKKVNNYKEIEKNIHMILSDKRVNSKREFFKITIEELKHIFDNIEEKYELEKNISEKENKIINKINNDIFDKLSKLKDNCIYYNKIIIKINHEKKRYNYHNYSSDNLVDIINIIVSIQSHIFEDDILEYYTTHYTKLSQGKSVSYHDLKFNFKEWYFSMAPINNYKEEYNKYYKNNYFKKIKEYLSKLYTYKLDSQIWLDMELYNNCNNNIYEPKYNILQHYKDNLITINQLKKDCFVIIEKKKISLHKYIE